jgi:anti-anti-sigma factor
VTGRGQLETVVDRAGTAMIVRISGRLDAYTSAQVRGAILMCLDHRPDLIVADLTAMVVADEVALTVFPAVARHVAAWPGAVLALAAAGPQAAEALERTAVSRIVPLHASVERAMVDTDRTGLERRLITNLPPTLPATAQARSMVAHACLIWGLHRQRDLAELIVTELVSNALRHAGTPMEIHVAQRARHLHLSVRDGSPALPRPGRSSDTLAPQGRGLPLIESLATGWGSMPLESGKVVWATLGIDDG